MSLDSNVTTRFSSQLLINASNPQNSGATTLDTGRLTLAETDVQACFQVLTGVSYDDTVATHVLYGTEGVFIRLLVITGQATMDLWNEWKRSLKEELALVTGRDRILPQTSSTMRVTPDQPLETVQMDRGVFDRFFIPRSPAANPSGNRDYLSNS